MVNFDEYKNKKESERKDKLHKVFEEQDKEMERYDSLLEQGDMFVRNNAKPTKEWVDSIVDSMMKLNDLSTKAETLVYGKTPEMSGFDEIVEGACEMMEENEIHVVK